MNQEQTALALGGISLALAVVGFLFSRHWLSFFLGLIPGILIGEAAVLYKLAMKIKKGD